MPYFLIATMVLAAASQMLYAQCEPSAPVREVLDKATLRGQEGLSRAGQNARRTAILKEGLKQHPHDYFLLRRLMLSEEDDDVKISATRAALESNPERPVYELIYADALIGRDTPEAIRRLEALKTYHPELTRAHYVLAYLSGFGNFKDPARAETGLDAFLAACPAPLDGGVLNIVANTGTKEQTAAFAAGLRQRLEKDTDPLLNSLWRDLWRAEFKVRPPAEHAALRKQIIEDLARLEKTPDPDPLRRMQLVAGGYQSAGDLAAVEKVNDQILERFPRSSAAKSILQERWRKQNPYPRNKPQAEIEAWSRAALAVHQEWHRRWPEDSLLYNTVFSSLAALPDTTPEQIAKAGDELMTSYRRDPRWWGMPPVEFRVASEFARRKVNLDKVPALVEEGYRAALKREQRKDDRYPQELTGVRAESVEILHVERARVLLDYYESVRQPESARAIEAELAAMSPAKPYSKSLYLQARAHAAELLGRRLDALMLYRAAVDVRPSAPAPGAKDALAENVERLWKELGGTPAARALLTDKNRTVEAAASRWERPKSPLPAFTLSDLEGKTWKLASLEGKVVLINLWATWCGPCRAEHPEFQKLYDKLKDRPGVTVISFNIDSDLGQVAPYMKENRYTFPVLLASELVRDYLPLVAIPQNWFLDARGQLQWIQVGYGSEPTWQSMMLAKLDEVVKGPVVTR